MAAAEMAFAGAGRAEQQEIGALPDPAVAGGERHHLGFADHGDGAEVEAVERLASGQARFGEMAFDAPPEAIGHFMLGQGGEEAGRRPAFLIGLFGELGPHQLDARQAQSR